MRRQLVLGSKMIRSLPLIVLFLLLACEKKGSSVKNSFQAQPPSQPASKDEEEEPEEEKVDPATLTVQNIQIAKLGPQLNNDGLGLIYSHSLSYETRGKRVDYVDVRVCPLQSKDVGSDGKSPCVTLISEFNRMRLSPIFEGQVGIYIKACVTSAHSSKADQECGPEASQVYTSTRRCPEQADIIEEKRIKRDNLEAHINAWRDAMVLFVKEAKACEIEAGKAKDYMESKIKFIETYVREPARWVSDSATTAVDSIFGEDTAAAILNGAEKSYDSFAQSMDDLCKGIARGIDESTQTDNTNSKSGGNVICSLGESVGNFGSMMVGMLNPSRPLGTFYSSISDVLAAAYGDTDKLVPKSCLADDNYNLRLESAANLIKNDIQALQELKTRADGLAKQCGASQ